MSEFDELFDLLERLNDKDGNVSVGWKTENGTLACSNYQFCHAAVNRAPSKCQLFASSTQRDSRGYTTSLGHGGWVGDDLAYKYYDWLANESPYQGSIITKDPEYIIKNGIVSEANAPGNLVVGGFIAQRYCWENPQLVRNMFAFAESGLSLNAAFTLVHLFAPSRDEIIVLNVASHVALETGGMGRDVISNFINKKPKNPSAPLSTRTSYSGITSLWGSPDPRKEELKTLCNLLNVGTGSTNVFAKIFQKKEMIWSLSISTSKFMERIPSLMVERYGEASHV